VDPGYERNYQLLEDSHWWTRARRDFVVRLVAQRLRVPRDAAVLDLGCSGGPLLHQLSLAGYQNLEGLDISVAAVALARSRGLTVHQGDASAPDLPRASFDLLIASDVLEHLADDRAALERWHALLKRGGRLVVLVPAFAWLWSEHDELNRHHRRYRRSQLTRLLRATGFEVSASSYWNGLLLAPAAVLRVGRRLLPRAVAAPRATLEAVPRPVDAALYRLLRAESSLLLWGVPFPAGLSAWAVARRR
jgi:SAM-dependent methyltransferase